MAVDDLHEEYTANIERWRLAEDVCEERDLAKYIYDLDISSKDLQSDKNTKFKKRASFLGATGFTEAAMIGFAFEESPEIELPAALEYLRRDASGEGVPLENHVILSLQQLLRKGRVGLFVTYPATDRTASIADQQAGDFAATIHAIDAAAVINWWSIKRGARSILGGVVFREVMETRAGFDVEKVDILRSLTLEDGGLVDRKWAQGDSNQWLVVPGSEVEPTDAAGNRWKEIPFVFAGATENSWKVDKAPLYSLARKNCDHYNNSAINEEGIWFSGHIQPVADEMDAHALDVLQGSSFQMGGGQLLIAKGFRFEVAEPNTAARQGMLDKVEEMRGIGARLLDPGMVAKTAQQDAGEQRAQHSVLSLAVVNLEDAYNMALRWVGEYMGTPGAAIELSRAFMDPVINSEILGRFIELWDRGLVGPSEVHRALSSAKLIGDEKTVDEYSEEVAQRGAGGAPLDGDA